MVTLDEFLPQFDVETSHSILIDAPASVVYETARRLDLSGSRLIRILFGVRGIPSGALTADGLTRIGFKLLREDPGHTIVYGLIGQFWTVRGNICDFDVNAFSDFDEAGYARAVWSFEVRRESDKTELTTVTRVLCADALSKRKFQRYWFFVGPFSGMIRREALRVVKSTSESVIHATSPNFSSS